MQGEPPVVLSSHREEANNPPSSVASFRGEHGGRFPQQTSSAEMGLQTGKHRVSEGLPKNASLATLDAFVSRGSHQIPKYMTWEQDSRAMAINALDYYWDPETWLFPLGPSHSSSSRGGLRTTDQGDSDLSGVEGSNVVASAGQTKDRKAPICLPAAVDCLKFPKGSTEELPNLDPLNTFHISGKVI